MPKSQAPSSSTPGPRARVGVEDVCRSIGVALVDVEKAAERLSGAAHVTPVLTSALLDAELSKNREDPDVRFFFKTEALQRTGSFKFRGAYNAASALTEEDVRAPLVTHSSGNHGQAVAAAARSLGLRAFVVVPNGAPEVKLAAIREYGAEVERCGPSVKERAEAADAVVERVGGYLVHPYLNKNVVAGQGTIALELLKQVEGLDALIVPIGGGGMISGISIVVKTLRPEIRIFGAEPLSASDAEESLRTGIHVANVPKAPVTMADGLRATLGSIGWTVVSNLVEDILTVSEDDISDATRLVWERMKVLIEPSAGVGVAAARSEAFKAIRKKLGLKRVGIILCGGNVDLNKLPWQCDTMKVPERIC